MANKSRGEVEFTLDGETYNVRPSFKVISEIESAVGGVMSFLGRLRTGNWTVSEVVSIMQAVLRSQSGAPKTQDIPELVFDAEDGPVGFIGPIAELLSNAITGGQKEPEGNGGRRRRAVQAGPYGTALPPPAGTGHGRAGLVTLGILGGQPVRSPTGPGRLHREERC